MSAPIIEVSHLRTEFGTQVVHRDVNLTILPSTITALIGGSGCGKSVLLRQLLRLLKPSAGTIKVLGHDIWELTDDELRKLRGQIGVLFQNGALFSALSVEENVAVPIIEQMDLPPDVVKDIARLRIALSGLPRTAATKMPSELSGGMRKRAGLARALALEPELLFLDEPTSGLDPINARAFDVLIRTLCDSLGLTIIMVTHDLDTLAGIVDQIVVLGEGVVLASGPPNQVKQQPIPWIQEYFAAKVR